MLALYPGTLLKLFISLKSFLVEFWDLLFIGSYNQENKYPNQNINGLCNLKELSKEKCVQCPLAMRVVKKNV